MDNPDINWDWERINYNPNLTLKMIMDNPNKPWNWYCMCHNPSITLEIIINNINEPWVWGEISKHSFEIDKQNYISQKIQWLLLATLFENYSNFYLYDKNNPYSRIELILSDNYFMKNIMKF